MRFSSRTLQFRYRYVKILPARSAVVPKQFVFHVADAFALHGVGHDAGGMTRRKGRVSERLFDGCAIVPIDFPSTPSKRPPFFCQRLEVDDILNAAQALDFVVVHYHYQVVEFVMRCKKSGLPHRTFLTLAVA